MPKFDDVIINLLVENDNTEDAVEVTQKTDATFADEENTLSLKFIKGTEEDTDTLEIKLCLNEDPEDCKNITLTQEQIEALHAYVMALDSNFVTEDGDMGAPDGATSTTSAFGPNDFSVNDARMPTMIGATTRRKTFGKAKQIKRSTKWV